GDGFQGWPEAAPFDAIVLTAAPERLPVTLVEQLAPGGRLVGPIGGQHEGQELVRLRKAEDGTLQSERLISVRFVPMTPAPLPTRAWSVRPCPVCEAPVTGWQCEVCGKQVGPSPAAANLNYPLEGLEPTLLPTEVLGLPIELPPGLEPTSSAPVPEVPGEPL